MDQFNLVKELVLDLLGWGVSPEYLVDCGLSREAVFYTFMELNLRLPQNLDVSGLLPSPSLPVQTLKDDTQALPIDNTKSSLNHPLPEKPSIRMSPVLVPTSDAQGLSHGQDLSDMEARRKLELQARKAVLASRRKKAAPNSIEPSTATSTSPATPAVLDGSIVDEPSPIAPVAAIDDFLKSMIETTSTPTQSSTSIPLRKARTLSGGVPLGVSPTTTTFPTNTPIAPTFPSTNVDVKEEVTHSIQEGAPLPSRQGSGSATSTSAIASSVDSGKSTPAPLVRQTSGLSSGSTTPPAETTRDQRAQNTFSSTSSGGQYSNGRRGTKRPVAMDFVDVGHDAGSQLNASAQPPYVRRKLTGFAGLGTHAHRKCVIDVSDSEEDVDEDTTGKQVSRTDPVLSSALSTPYGTMTPQLAPRPPSTRPASSTGINAQKSASPSLSPEALEEKERQIKQMRELIARREQERLRKLAEVSLFGLLIILSVVGGRVEVALALTSCVNNARNPGPRLLHHPPPRPRIPPGRYCQGRLPPLCL